MNIITSVSPITDIYILKGVPLDPSYSDTIDFENKEAQETYFKSKKKYNWSECSPCNMQNTIGIPVVADKVYDCNYIMFKNANFSNKWFYAFITNIEYININSCKLSFSIDVLQTWMFDYSWRRCLVEREHTNDDSIGANLVEEGLNLGDYVREDLHFAEERLGINVHKPYEFDADDGTHYSVMSVSIVAGCSFKYDFNSKSITDEIETTYRFGLYSGLNFYAFTSPASFDDFINVVTSSGKIDGIMCCYSFPTALLTFDITPDVPLPKFTLLDFLIDEEKRPNTIGNYTPKNKKLLTFPYISFEINTSEGDISEHRFEYLINNTEKVMHFKVGISIINTGEVVIIPVYYYGSGDRDIRYDKAIGLSNFPMVGWVSDTYRAYIAQNASSLNYQYKAIEADFNYNKTMGMVNAANSYVGGLLGGVPSAVNSAINASQVAPATPVAPTGTGMAGFGMALANVLPSAISAGTNYAMNMVGNAYNMKKAQMSFKAAMEDYDRKPNTAHGATVSNARITSGFWGFKFYNKHIREDYAKIIDGYFSMYGYKTMKVKVPNIKGRAEWNYVKVNKASIIPNSVAASDIDMIKSIFENGVTIWHNPSNVGKYNLDNSIVS